MKRTLIGMTVILLNYGASSQVDAATQEATARVGTTGIVQDRFGCYDGGFGASFADCGDSYVFDPPYDFPWTYAVEGSASARSVFGNLGVSAQITMQGAPLAGNVSAVAGAGFSDVIKVLDYEQFLENNPDVESVTLVIPVSIEGSNAVSETGGQYVRSEVALTFGSDFGPSTTIYREKVESYGGAVYREAVGSLGTTTVSFELLSRGMDSGLLSEGVAVVGGMVASVDCYNNPGSTECFGSASFYNSAILGSAGLFDQNGDPISGLAISSESGFDYLSGYIQNEPPVVSQIPLPASSLLFASACLLFPRRASRTFHRVSADK